MIWNPTFEDSPSIMQWSRFCRYWTDSTTARDLAVTSDGFRRKKCGAWLWFRSGMLGPGFVLALLWLGGAEAYIGCLDSL